MSTSTLTRLGHRQACFPRTVYRQKPVHSGSLKIRLTHNVVANATKVEKILLDNIKATGPLPFSTYMQLCLSHPTHGYYMNSSNKVFGSGGDFITSPEISQVFGELIGIWLLSQWANSAKNHPFRLVELGPGRGTLMDDILRVVSKIVPSGKTIDVHLVETSPAMRALQQAKLSSDEQFNIKIHWHNSINEVTFSPSEYTMLVAHEFFDALPIHILQKMQTGWHEVLVASNMEEEKAESNVDKTRLTAVATALQRVLARNPSTASALLGYSSPRFQGIPVGSSLEVSPTAFRIAHKIGQLLSSENSGAKKTSLGGCGLIIDYGGDKAFGDSFRAFKEHKIVDVFHEPGNCDLTSNVDFAYLKEAMSGLVTTYGPISQGTFLERMGLELRLQSLLKAAETDKRRKEIREAAARLIDPLGMGKEYQVMGITNKLPKSEESVDTVVWPFFDEKP
ncbi:DUF185-domain-containing protein [Phlegmacium glaucopus]|nr:DUF185-domain-containing protein [Phlegmacium glaucopus]